MWKSLTIIAIITAVAEWLLFGMNIMLTGYFNWITFILATAWSIWSIYTFFRYHKEKYSSIKGIAYVHNKWVKVECIDESGLIDIGKIRVIWRDEQNRRVTSFVDSTEVRKY